MKKNIELIIDGIAPEKVLYDTDNHSLVVLYPAQKEFKKGDILASGDTLLIFDKYEMFKQEKDLFHSIWNNWGVAHNKNWTTKHFKHATGEQIVQLHEELREEGKKWNAETLQVEDIEPEFKRGDIVIHDNTKRISIFDSYENKYSRFNAIFSIGRSGDIDYNRSWVTNTVRYATSSEIEKFDNDLKEIGKKWNKETLEVEDLDISDIVVDLVSACKYLNKKVPSFSSLFFSLSVEDYNKYYAQITLQLIREAWNKFDGFEADWDDNEQNNKYFLIIDDDKIATSCHNVVKTIELACYSFATRERALQFGNQFKELFREAMGL